MASSIHLALPPGAAPGGEATSWFRFGHDVASHALLGLDALAALAGRLPPQRIELGAAAAPHLVEGEVTVRLPDAELDMDAPAIVERLEEDRRSITLRNIEDDPVHGPLVREIFEEFVRSAELAPGAAYRPEGYVFLAASGTVTPAHVDHEHNLFLQIRGTKRFTTGSFPSSALRDQTFERMYDGEYGNTPFPPSDPVEHVLHAGDGLYVPPDAVHVVENGDAPAISLSLVFHDAPLRAARVYACNSHLRRLGLTPRGPGASPVRDQMKAGIVTGWRRVGRVIRRS